jgi:hypothetical protein
MDNKNMPAMPKGLVVTEGGGIYGNDDSELGLTKLEHFTALAMQSVITRIGTDNSDHDGIAAQSVKIANAVLDELDKIKE